MSYLSFVLHGQSDSGKTYVWEVRSANGGNILGMIGWYSPWRRYTFASTSTTNIFDAACLHEVADFCASRTQNHKEALATAKAAG